MKDKGHGVKVGKVRSWRAGVLPDNSLCDAWLHAGDLVCVRLVDLLFLIVFISFTVAWKVRDNKAVAVGWTPFFFLLIKEIFFLAKQDDLAQWLVGGKAFVTLLDV